MSLSSSRVLQSAAGMCLCVLVSAEASGTAAGGRSVEKPPSGARHPEVMCCGYVRRLRGNVHERGMSVVS